MQSCSNAIGGSFGLFGQGSPADTSNGGYQGFVMYLGTSNNLRIRAATDRTLTLSGWQTLVEAPHQIDNALHTFRVEFDNSRISFFFDGTLVLETTSTLFRGSVIGIEDAFCQITVNSFKVYGI